MTETSNEIAALSSKAITEGLETTKIYLQMGKCIKAVRKYLLKILI